MKPSQDQWNRAEKRPSGRRVPLAALGVNSCRIEYNGRGSVLRCLQECAAQLRPDWTTPRWLPPRGRVLSTAVCLHGPASPVTASRKAAGATPPIQPDRTRAEFALEGQGGPSAARHPTSAADWPTPGEASRPRSQVADFAPPHGRLFLRRSHRKTYISSFVSVVDIRQRQVLARVTGAQPGLRCRARSQRPRREDARGPWRRAGARHFGARVQAEHNRPSSHDQTHNARRCRTGPEGR